LPRQLNFLRKRKVPAASLPTCYFEQKPNTCFSSESWLLAIQ